jgi:hypothetical protein
LNSFEDTLVDIALLKGWDQLVGCRNTILNREIYTDTADRRHRMSRIADT